MVGVWARGARPCQTDCLDQQPGRRGCRGWDRSRRHGFSEARLRFFGHDPTVLATGATYARLPAEIRAGSCRAGLVFRLSIFVLAVFVGYFVVWSVTPALHTPLMSVTNAISSVIVVGALLAVGVSLVGNDNGPIWARAFGFVALIFACVNIFGGFLVTQRMLAMYQKKKK